MVGCTSVNVHHLGNERLMIDRGHEPKDDGSALGNGPCLVAPGSCSDARSLQVVNIGHHDHPYINLDNPADVSSLERTQRV